jgi:hypothetical protein
MPTDMLYLPPQPGKRVPAPEYVDRSIHPERNSSRTQDLVRNYIGRLDTGEEQMLPAGVSLPSFTFIELFAVAFLLFS